MLFAYSAFFTQQYWETYSNKKHVRHVAQDPNLFLLQCVVHNICYLLAFEFKLYKRSAYTFIIPSLFIYIIFLNLRVYK